MADVIKFPHDGSGPLGDEPPPFDPDDPGPDAHLDDPLSSLITRFNQKYMVVNEKGKTIIYCPVYDEALKRKCYDRTTFGAFRELYLNTAIQVSTGAKGKAVFATHAEAWLNSFNRRQYIGGVVFDPSGRKLPPDILNLWQGFAVQPREGSWQKLKDHTLEIVCAGNTDHFEWLMSWMARLVQQPAEQGEVSVVMRGGQGTGKGMLAKALCRVIGHHALLISNAKHLTGNFNAHLQDCVFLFADEAFYAGDKQHVGVLKSLITDDLLFIEAKHKNGAQSRNYIHLIMASNEAWVVPADLDDRRFFILEVLPDRKQDTEYFGQITKELENGGYEAMLFDLMKWDISDFDHRSAPKTAGLDTQKALSLPFFEKWWLSVLQRGYITKSKHGLSEHFEQWISDPYKILVHEAYLAAAKSASQWHPMGLDQFGKAMIKFGAKSGKQRKVIAGEEMRDEQTGFGGTARKASIIWKENAHTYRLGTLSAARAAFEAATGLPIPWDIDEPYQDPLL